MVRDEYTTREARIPEQIVAVRIVSTSPLTSGGRRNEEIISAPARSWTRSSKDDAPRIVFGKTGVPRSAHAVVDRDQARRRPAAARHAARVVEALEDELLQELARIDQR